MFRHALQRRYHVLVPASSDLTSRYISRDWALKHFAHVCVFPRREFNTHVMDTDAEARGEPRAAADGGGPASADGEAEDERARFVFHPAGRRNKLDCLRRMVLCRGGDAPT
jgi:hypothetical protein